MSASFQEALRGELMSAARRPARRPRSHVAAIAIAGVAVLIVGLAPLMRADPASADVEVSVAGGRVHVELTDLDSSAATVQAALVDAGLDIQVEPAPAGPSNVGRFVGERVTADDPSDVERTGRTGETFMGFSIPDDWTGGLTVLVGRAAEPGEPYATFSDAFAPGEPLACTDTLGHPLSDAAPHLAGYDVTIRTGTDAGAERASLASALRDERRAWLVTSAIAFSSTQLLVTVAESSPKPTGAASC